MKFGSLFAGIGGFDLGFERAGMTCAWQVEKEPSRHTVLRARFPGAKLFDDVRTVPALRDRSGVQGYQGGCAMKVILFVRNGDARPKCIWTLKRVCQPELEAALIRAAETSQRPFLEYDSHFAIAAESDDWWIVLCKTADAGRDVIEWERTGGPDPVLNEPCPFGRVLASRGKPRS